MAVNKSKFPQSLWDGTTPSRPDPNVVRAAQPEDWEQVVVEVRSAQQYVYDHIQALIQNTEDDTRDAKQNAFRQRQAARAQKKGLRYRMLGGGLVPATVAGAASLKQHIGLAAGEHCCIDAVVIEYLTLPTTAGAYTYELYTRKGGVDTLLATMDLMTLVADTAKLFAIEGQVQPLSRIWGRTVSDNGDAVDGTEGLITLHGQIQA